MLLIITFKEILLIITFKEILRLDIFHQEMKYLRYMENMVPSMPRYHPEQGGPRHLNVTTTSLRSYLVF